MSTHTEITNNHDADGGDHGEHAHGGPKVYATTLVILLILTFITVGAAYINLGAGNVVVALFIATIKATLVALFFMHLRWDKPVNGIIAMAGFLFLGIFLMFCVLDASSRNYYLPQNLHRTETPLTPGTAPAALTEMLPDTATGAPPQGIGTYVPGTEKAPAAAEAPAPDKK
jgi:cytochrome c oxidase subunit 4